MFFFFNFNLFAQIEDTTNVPEGPTYAQSPTYANIAGPENVLVVYKNGDSVSTAIANYYMSARNIPAENKIGLNIPDSADVLVNNYYYPVKLKNNGEIIFGGITTNNGEDIPTSWYFYQQYLHQPLESFLDTTTDTNGILLKDKIRFIITCKGIPLKIQFTNLEPWTTLSYFKINIAIDPLLCLLNQNNNNFSIIDLFQKGYKSIINPYYYENYLNNEYSFDNRFKTNHFYTILNSDTLKINYLVTRLDGQNYNIVKSIIDKAKYADKTGEKFFIIDADPYNTTGPNSRANTEHMNPAKEKLESLGFNYLYDYTTNWLTECSYDVIAYTSMGHHARMPRKYIYNDLDFNYSNGSYFNSYESYNGYSMDSTINRDDQGMITDFISTGGTSGGGNTWEPWLTGVPDIKYIFTAYAMGYTLAEATYMGIQYLAWQNVVIGDPLMTIAWGKQTLLENTTWDGTNLVTGEITVPQGKTLTVNSGAVINFKHFGSLKVEGNLVINQGANMFFYNDSSLTVNHGTVTANGIPSNKIIFDFVAPNGNTSNGIKMKGGTLTLTNCVIKNAYNGIDAVKGDDLFVEKTYFENIENTGVSVTRFESKTPWLKECSFEDIQYGVIAAGGDEAVIKNCSFHNAKLSVYASQIAAAAAIGNSITADSTFNGTDPDGYGIYYNSSGGIISKNQIGGHYYGVYLANSSPYVGANNIVTSAATGIYASSGSMPDLSETIITSHECQADYVYPVSGFNTIDQNGNLDSLNGAEIYLYSASVDLQNGRNTISDDRGGAVNNILIGGTQNPWPGTYYIWAENNYWGASVSSSRFGSELTVDFQPYLSAPVPVPQSGACPYIIYDNEGTAIDTVYPYVERSGLSGSAKSYAEAGGNFLKGEYEAAKSIYNSIISGETPDMKDYKAYERLYVIEKLMKSAPEAFEALAGFYSGKRAESSDEMLNDFLEQLERLCTVSAEEYAGAIAEFTSVAEANPRTETAVNAEVDALTTALIAANSGLGKITAGKYAVGGLSDYTRKINGLLNIGKNSLNTEDDKIETPKEFVLRQNYPNPYNPTTTIKYEIPERSFVELKVFDILGREVAVLANGVKEAGRYEVTFNANSLSSGVYIYRLKTANKIISKKMILLR